MSNRFNFTWYVEDGYVNNGPHSSYIGEDDLDEDMTDSELREFFWDMVRADFDNLVSYVSDAEEEFLSWARERIAEIKSE